MTARLTLPAVVLLLSPAQFVRGQVIDTVVFEEIGRYQHPYVSFPEGFSAPTLSSRIDRLDRPYLYMACKDSGVMTLDITDPSMPIVADRHYPSFFDDLNVMNLEQVENLLYVCLGNFQGNGQSAGLATVDVSDPASPIVLDIWSGGSTYVQGSAIVRIDGDRAYLGAMEDGIIVLDVGDPSDIQFVSSYQPDPTWPGIAGYPPNGRGMAIDGDMLYLAYDAGGMRAIDISTPTALTEIGRYLNPDIPALTNPAYNNVVVVGDRAYCTIDYCGVEVVDISDPANMTQVAWLNPWNCIGLSWFGSDGHTNELITAHNDSLLFVSGADSEVLVYDIADGDTPQLKGGHILPNDTASTWGVDVLGDRVVANYINNHGLPLQPYDSHYGGVVLFDWQMELSTAITGTTISTIAGIAVRPNPSSEVVHVTIPATRDTHALIRIMDAQGRIVMQRTIAGTSVAHELTLDLSGEGPGLYRIGIATSDIHSSATLLLYGPR